MKSFVVCIFLASLLLCQLATCDDKVEDVEQKDQQQTAKEPEELSSPKTKRGIFHHSGYPSSAHHHALTYNVPLGTAVHPHYGFQKPWHHVTYAKTPFTFSPSFVAPPPVVHHHALHHHPTVVHTAPAPPPLPAVTAVRPHLLITPGGASVTSYNVNYPRYAFTAKPQFHFDIPVSAPRPAVFGVQQPSIKPIIPVAVPAFSNRIPIFSRPTYHHHVVQSLPAPTPVYPVTAGVPHSHIHPQFIPVQPTIATIPTTFATIPTLATTAPVLPAGTHHHHHFGGVAPTTTTDQWRPIFVGPTPTQNTFATAPSAATGRPSVSLLPPLGSAPAGAAAGSTIGVGGDQHHQQQALFHQLQQQQQFELQQQFETSDFGAGEQQNQVNQLYGPPADVHSSHQDFIQGWWKFFDSDCVIIRNDISLLFIRDDFNLIHIFDSHLIIIRQPTATASPTRAAATAASHHPRAAANPRRRPVQRSRLRTAIEQRTLRRSIQLRGATK